jgi:predicted Zn-dependent protease
MDCRAVNAGIEAALALAIQHYNGGRREAAESLCRGLLPHHAMQPALLQLLAVLCHERGALAEARGFVEASLAARPGHGPTLMVAALIRQDQHEPAAAQSALEQVLQQQPGHVPARVNLGIVLLEQGQLGEAMKHFGRAWRQRPETLARIAGALCAEGTGALWIRAADLRDALDSAARLERKLRW